MVIESISLETKTRRKIKVRGDGPCNLWETEGNLRLVGAHIAVGEYDVGHRVCHSK